MCRATSRRAMDHTAAGIQRPGQVGASLGNERGALVPHVQHQHSGLARNRANRQCNLVQRFPDLDAHEALRVVREDLHAQLTAQPAVEAADDVAEGMRHIPIKGRMGSLITSQDPFSLRKRVLRLHNLRPPLSASIIQSRLRPDRFSMPTGGMSGQCALPENA